MTQGCVGLDLLAQTKEPLLCLVEIMLPLQSHDARESSGFEPQRPDFTTLQVSNLLAVSSPLLGRWCIGWRCSVMGPSSSAYTTRWCQSRRTSVTMTRLRRQHLSQLLHIRIRQIRPQQRGNLGNISVSTVPRAEQIGNPSQRTPACALHQCGAAVSLAWDAR